MKSKIIVLFLISIFLVAGCSTGNTTKEIEKMSRDKAEYLGFKFLYEHTKNKEVYDKELKVENYVFDSWKEGDIWHIIVYVGHTFVEILVYDDGSENIKILTQTDYWQTVPPELKEKVFENMNKNANPEVLEKI